MSKRRKLVLLGPRQSGKTAYLAKLSATCTKPVLPDTAQKFLRSALRDLEEEIPLEPTKEEAPMECIFSLELGEGFSPIRVKTRDYSGSLTTALNRGILVDGFTTFAGKELKNVLREWDWILFVADCVRIREAGGWDAWAADNLLDILRFCSNVVSDTKRKPLALLLAKSDLVPEEFVEECRVQAQNTLREFGWGGPKRGAKGAERVSLVLPYRYDEQESTLAPLRALWRFEKRTNTLPLVVVPLLFIVIMASVLISWALKPKEKPVTSKEFSLAMERLPSDLGGEREAKRWAGRLYIKQRKFGMRPPWSRIARHWFPKFDTMKKGKEALKTARSLYLKKLSQVAFDLIKRIDYKAKEMMWFPKKEAKILTTIEEDLRWLGAKERRETLFQARKKRLDRQLRSLSGLNGVQLEALARRYVEIHEAVPDALIQHVSEFVYASCLKEVAKKINGAQGWQSREKFKKLYEEELPGILDGALQRFRKDLFVGKKRRELEKALKYLKYVGRTEKIVFRVEKFHQSEEESYILEMRVAAPKEKRFMELHPVLNRGVYCYPIDGSCNTKREEVTTWPEGKRVERVYTFDDAVPYLEIPWHYGDYIEIDAWDVEENREHLVKWRSNAMGGNETVGGHKSAFWAILDSSAPDQGGQKESQEEEDDCLQDYDLPGLTYLILKRAQKETHGIDRDTQFYKLELTGKSNTDKLLVVPKFLREANREAKRL